MASSAKVFVGGLSWETTGERLRSYFENYGVVREAFVSYNRANGRPRGFGFVVFEAPDVADKVVSTKHTIDRREVSWMHVSVGPACSAKPSCAAWGQHRAR
jgi:RNA recognition motif-containing protein